MTTCICCLAVVKNDNLFKFFKTKSSHICLTCVNKDWGDYKLCRFCGGIYKIEDIKEGCKCINCHKCEMKQYRKDHNQELKTYFKKMYQKNKKKINAKNVEYRSKNTNARLGNNLRSRINKALHGVAKSKNTVALLGCSIENFKQHIESQWDDKMSWDNYGLYGWHIDHIIPCYQFDLTDSAQQALCFHYTNMQPLWAGENLSKNKYIKEKHKLNSDK
jgi:hypothetical protein